MADATSDDRVDKLRTGAFTTSTAAESGTKAGVTDPYPLPGLPADWHVLATDKIVQTVDQVKVKTAGPAIGVARSAVFGILAALLAVIAVPLFLIGLVRLLNEYIPAGVWLVYLILGTIFMLVGVLLWSKRPRGATT